MYRGNLCSLESYRNIPFKLIDIVQLVKRKIQANSEVGTYPVIGDDAFYFIVEDKTKHFLESRAEIHDKYIDVQIVLEGTERYGYSLTPFNSIDEDYIDDKDVAFSSDINDEQFVTLNKDDFIIFDTKQPHRPLVAVSNPEPVKKAVVKINKQYLRKFSEV
ncbi:YhcH/YjgK/YiaL family protein [Photobacterium satsumensis]|uniref:YhcH/YjgK/YiaL family protein n=1 Tax=Photobacterium satsumensis TaxID=2910239 RepID=UPI003D09ACB4